MAAAAPMPGAEPGGSNKGEASSSKPVKEKSFQDFGHPARKGTDMLLVLNAACFVLQWLSKDVLTYWGAKVNALISAGQWWRLLTPTFLHSSVFHLCINSYALNSIGPHVELVGGHARFGAVYAVSALTGTLASFVFTPSPSLGSSGALFGLGGALALFYWRHREVLGAHSDAMLRSLGITAAVNLAYSVWARNIDNWGHLGGLVGGALVGWLLGPNLIRDEKGRFIDKPPVSWLAFQPGTSFSQRSSSRSSSKSRQQLAAGSGAGSSAAGEAGESDRRKTPKKGRRNKGDEEEGAGGQA
eukprot:CAMPEP_0202860592 /NCGR_PEP_ID=MMETSP1391-20130828/2243_1 /ASSEMBLY_ACC=CAM_ASM_000867 /TAXON_ID=1034604 /ORGANISM="Chlamydomonas leiostraca, Strain SAG 11-49" /LENGTH=299 /DNA_ID=CAMNT_0049539791 /DNA_START=224 /DNA_END=1123 /DNA_ORIENTATION=-